MKIINPVGRSVGGGDEPNACVCAKGFAGYRTSHDTFTHCGCGCDSDGAYRTGNRTKAITTIRKSPAK